MTFRSAEAASARRTISLIVLLVLTGCAKPKNVFMDTPALYSSAGVQIDRVTAEDRQTPTLEILYATDRHYDPDRPKLPYTDQRDRSMHLRLGAAEIRIGEEGATWDEVAEATTAMRRRRDLRMYVEGVDDFGPLSDTVWEYHEFAGDPDRDVPRRRFAELVNERLASSRTPEIIVYIAQYRVDFESALFTAAEFFHYLGRDGVAIAYSWPTGTGAFDYFAATENANLTVGNLRLFLEYLARETNAERIHLMTYSAGARVVGGAMQQLRLRYSELSEAEVKDHLRIGHVVYTGPDLDAAAFGAQIRDGAAEIAQSITIYTMKLDRALGASMFFFRFDRLGTLDVGDFGPEGIAYLRDQEAVSFVQVVEAENATAGNAHGYFRKSPWVSSDILLNLGVSLPPSERCLHREPGAPIWTFPADYRDSVAELVDRLTER